MMPRGQINITELDTETTKRLGLKTPPKPIPVEGRLVGLGKVLSALAGLTTREAIWVLRQSIHYLEGSRGRVKQ